MSTELEIREDQTTFNDTQRAALSALGVEEAPAGDVALLFHLAKRSGLDPFARQIYLIGRNAKVDNKWTKKYTVQTGIDGLRVLRDRTGKYQGHTTEWCGPDRVWVDAWLEREPPVAARVSVYVKDRVVPQVGIARWDEYVQTTSSGEVTSMWRSKSSLMLAKCAEAIAYRQAFPQDFSGIYLEEEMHQADNGTLGMTQVQPAQAPVIASGPGKPAQAVKATKQTAEDQHAIADEWALRARNALTVTDARDLYRDAKHRGILDYPTTTGELLEDVLRARGEHLADEEAQAAAGEAGDEGDVPLDLLPY